MVGGDMMADYPKQLRERITKFREQKGVSESRMSRELGQSKCYLQQISSGKTLPSMGAFFRIYESNTILLGKKDGLEKDSPGGLSDVATIQYKGNRNTQVTSIDRKSVV